jgi:hypothetical protein
MKFLLIIFLAISSLNVHSSGNMFASQPDTITAINILDRYIDIVGGAKRLSSVLDMSQKGFISVQGMNISLHTIQKFPDKVLTEMKLNNRLLNKTIMFGGKAFSTNMYNDGELTGLSLDLLKFRALIFPEHRLEEFGFAPVLKGREIFDGRDNFVIEIGTPSGDFFIEYYDVESGLKTKTVAVVDTPEGKVQQETRYLEYFFMDGIRYIRKMKQTNGKQTLEIYIDGVAINTNPPDALFQ